MGNKNTSKISKRINLINQNFTNDIIYLSNISYFSCYFPCQTSVAASCLSLCFLILEVQIVLKII